MADAVRFAIDGGNGELVRYESRAQAIVDVLAGVAAGDFRRAWAWRQLGLWQIGENPSQAAGVQANSKRMCGIIDSFQPRGGIARSK